MLAANLGLVELGGAGGGRGGVLREVCFGRSYGVGDKQSILDVRKESGWSW